MDIHPDSHQYAGVVLDIPVDTVFTYEIPSALSGGRIRTGMRVRVPFGNRSTTGFVVSTSPVPPSGLKRIRPISQVFGSEPPLTQELITLAKWMSKFYICSLGEVIACIAPPIARAVRPHIFVSLATPPDNALAEAERIRKRSSRQAAILEFLAERSPVRHLELLKKCGGTLATLKSLAKKELIKLESPDLFLDEWSSATDAHKAPPRLTSHQQKAVDTVTNSIIRKQFATYLLHGVTGSGKTEVYIQAISEVVMRGGQAIVLVPEIALTPQTIARFAARFPKLAVLHSAMSSGMRRKQWELARKGKADVVIGARSAVFAPCPDLRLIVIDEEHEPSYKQDATPRYHAREVAVIRAKDGNATVLLGSATPSLESYHNALTRKFAYLELPDRVGEGVLPEVVVVDMKEERRETKRNVTLSRALVRDIKWSLSKDRQILLFLNRRGFHVFGRCSSCGGVMRCPHCDITLTLHKGRNVLLCHYCGFFREKDQSCPECGSQSIYYGGSGTERIEEVLSKVFPDASVARMDADTTSRRNSHAKILAGLKDGKTDILLGTQMVAKGLHYPNITTVGVLDADISLYIPDFRSTERTFQLLSQVAGRTGRGEDKGRVIIQTSMPGLFAIRCAAQHDYKAYAKRELQHRREFEYPPFTRMCKMTAKSVDAKAAKEFLETVREAIAEAAKRSKTKLLGPVAAPISRIEGKYRYQLVMKSPTQKALVELANLAKFTAKPPSTVAFVVDMNPISLM